MRAWHLATADLWTDQQQIQLCFDFGRRRSVDNRDNGAPRDSTWHGAEDAEAAIQVLNDL